MKLRLLRGSLGRQLPGPPLAMVLATTAALFLLGRGVITDRDGELDTGFVTVAMACGGPNESSCNAEPQDAIAASDLPTAAVSAVASEAPAILIAHDGGAPFSAGAVSAAAALAAIHRAAAEDRQVHGLPFDPLTEPSFSHDEPEVAEPTTSEARVEASIAPDATDTFIRKVSHRIRPGETISQVLDSAGVAPTAVGEWLRAADRVYDLDHVYAGQEVSLQIDTRSQSLSHLALEIDRKSLLVAERGDAGIVVERRDVPHFLRVRAVGGEINSSLYMAAMAQRIPDRVVSDMAEILGWELDFARDVRPGATFRVAYEEIVRLDTHESIPGRVLAVDVVNRGRTHEGYWFTADEKLRGGYYDRAGRALGRAFLRYPVEYSRITSHFSTERFHPIKKVPMPHYGVDFAAPTGTPVVASADGEVLKAGWFGGNGRMVKLRHGDVYQSAYAHLSRIEAGIEAGAKVKKGEIIGYVGATGLATGPHLHYAMYRNGGYIDPLNTELPHERSLEGSVLQSFEVELGIIDRAYAKAGYGGDGVAQVATAPGE